MISSSFPAALKVFLRLQFISVIAEIVLEIDETQYFPGLAVKFVLLPERE